MVLDIADDCLVRVYGDVLDRNLLLASIAVVIEPFGRHDHRALHCRPLSDRTSHVTIACVGLCSPVIGGIPNRFLWEIGLATPGLARAGFGQLIRRQGSPQGLEIASRVKCRPLSAVGISREDGVHLSKKAGRTTENIGKCAPFGPSKPLP